MINNFRSKLVEKKRLAANIYLFRFVLITPSKISFTPGQYMILKIDGKPRLYSIASSYINKNFLEFIVELVPGGLASEFLKKLSMGNEVIWQGPAGMFHLKDEKTDSIFLATGTGIAPIRSMINSLVDSKTKTKKIFLFWGLRYYQDIYLFDEWKKIEKRLIGDFQFVYCLSREKDLSAIKEEERKNFFSGHIQEALNHYFPTPQFFSTATFYLCGSRLVVEDLRQFLEEKGVEKERVIFERF